MVCLTIQTAGSPNSRPFDLGAFDPGSGWHVGSPRRLGRCGAESAAGADGAWGCPALTDRVIMTRVSVKAGQAQRTRKLDQASTKWKRIEDDV